MPLTVTCPACGKAAGIPAAAVGKRVQCPSCGRPFVAAPQPPPLPPPPPVVLQAAPARHRQDDEEEPPRRQRPRSDGNRGRDDEGYGFRCPFCRTTHHPRVRSKITGGGWLLFVLLLLLFCWPLCWIPLAVMREDYRVCRGCGVKLD